MNVTFPSYLFQKYNLINVIFLYGTLSLQHSIAFVLNIECTAVHKCSTVHYVALGELYIFKPNYCTVFSKATYHQTYNR